MKIEVLGTGCARCESLAANVKAAADKLGLDYELVKVSDLNEMTSRGVIMPPAVAINGQIKLTGKVASEAELTTLLAAATS